MPHRKVDFRACVVVMVILAAAFGCGSGPGTANGSAEASDVGFRINDAAAVGPDASDAATDAVADADGGTDAVADAAVPDNGPGIACSALAGVGTIYYSRGPVTLVDGTKMTDGEMWAISGDGADDSKIGGGEFPRLSPDRQSLVFHRDNVNYYSANLYVRNMVAGIPPTDTLVYVNPKDYVVDYSWTADSASIVFDWECAIYKMDRDGSNRHKFIDYLESNCYSDAPSVNPVDGRVAWDNFYDGLGLSDADGTNAHHVPNTYPNATGSVGAQNLNTAGDHAPVWSPDGKTLVFVSKPTLNFWESGPLGPLYKINPDGTGRVLLTPGLSAIDGFYSGGAFSPDGTRFIGAGVYMGVNGIYSVPLDGSGNFQRVCISPGAPVNYVGTALAY